MIKKLLAVDNFTRPKYVPFVMTNHITIARMISGSRALLRALALLLLSGHRFAMGGNGLM
ncbi:MAG: hypothetical protein KJ626_09690 [Verrucomicrobia bacterium]|nr:hypothetical protein [Verrucomicrobiota bacterium]